MLTNANTYKHVRFEMHTYHWVNLMIKNTTEMNFFLFLIFLNQLIVNLTIMLK